MPADVLENSSSRSSRRNRRSGAAWASRSRRASWAPTAERSTSRRCWAKGRHSPSSGQRSRRPV